MPISSGGRGPRKCSVTAITRRRQRAATMWRGVPIQRISPNDKEASKPKNSATSSASSWTLF